MPQNQHVVQTRGAVDEGVLNRHSGGVAEVELDRMDIHSGLPLKACRVFSEVDFLDSRTRL